VEAALKAIAEPRRRQILRLVWDAERSAGEIASYFDVSRPAISQHLTVLRTAGLVTERRDGARRLYLANRDALAELQASLEAFWTGSLASLKGQVEAEEGRRRGRGNAHRQR
jgi:DNA-binding transcriptional ArsR family regulator